MTIANTAVLIAAVMPVITMGIAKASTAGKKRSQGGYDNNNPREWTGKLEGWRARAAAAQNNGFEALPLFVFGVLAAQMAGLDQARTDQLAMIFIGLRIVYTIIYFANIAALRSLVWAVALGVNIAIFAPTLKLPF
ncbi:MAG: MAPEG family protein [Aquabacterium sp.]